MEFGCAILAAVEELIRQIRAASVAELYYLALFGALALPDICGALASNDGKASGSKYKMWLRDNVPSQANEADSVYGLRCSLIHQGRAQPHSSAFPIAFTYPSPNVGQIHNLSTVVNGDRVGWLSIPIFVDEVCGGAEAWLVKFGASQTVLTNYEKFARFRPEGLPPHFAGPVIALSSPRAVWPVSAAPGRVGTQGGTRGSSADHGTSQQRLELGECCNSRWSGRVSGVMRCSQRPKPTIPWPILSP